MRIPRRGSGDGPAGYGSGAAVSGSESRDLETGRAESLRVAAASGGLTLLACVAVILGTPSDAYWINDCGNKALVAERLLATGFRELAFDYPAERIDPERRAFPIAAPFALERPSGFVSTYPPAYAAVAVPFLAAFGRAGLRIPAALGVALCAALLSGWLAASVGALRAFAAGATLALATPLFFYGVTVWEHSLTVALCLGAWWAAARPTPVRWLAAGASIGAACWFREEVALMGIALAVAAVAITRRPAPAAWLLAGVGIPALGLLLLNWQIYGDPLGVHFAASAGAGAAASGLPGRATLGVSRIAAGILGGYGRNDLEGALLGTAALVTPALGFAAARSRRGGLPVWVGITAVGLAAWGLGWTRTATAAAPLAELVRYNGLLVQLPLWCLVGFGAERMLRDARLAELRVGVLAAGIFVALAVASGLWSSGGYGAQAGFGVHWGPRTLLPAFPAVVALAFVAAPGGAGPPARAQRIVARTALGLLMLAGLLSSAQAVRMLAAQKLDAQDFQKALRALPTRSVLTTHPLLAQHISAAWHEKPMLLAADADHLTRTLARLRSAGEREFAFVAPAGAPLLTWTEGLECRLVARPHSGRLHYFDLDIQMCRFSGRGRLPGRAVRPR